MQRLFEGKVWVHEGQMYFLAAPTLRPDRARCFRGQRNGLCGAAVPGVLFLVTGLHTGSVRLIIDACEAPPAIDDSWDEVVEVSFRVPRRASPGIMEWGASSWHAVPLAPGVHRARFSARNMQAGEWADTVRSHEEPVDAYHLCFWPARSAPDSLIRQSSSAAARRHAQVGAQQLATRSRSTEPCCA